MDYQIIINEIGELLAYACPLGLIIGLIEWLVYFFFDCALDRRRSRIL